MFLASRKIFYKFLQAMYFPVQHFKSSSSTIWEEKYWKKQGRESVTDSLLAISSIVPCSFNIWAIENLKDSSC